MYKPSHAIPLCIVFNNPTICTAAAVQLHKLLYSRCAPSLAVEKPNAPNGVHTTNNSSANERFGTMCRGIDAAVQLHKLLLYSRCAPSLTVEKQNASNVVRSRDTCSSNSSVNQGFGTMCRGIHARSSRLRRSNVYRTYTGRSQTEGVLLLYRTRHKIPHTLNRFPISQARGTIVGSVKGDR